VPDRAPAFQFYPKDFLTDEKVVRMSNTEVGIYTRLLCYCWLEGSLPLETDALAHMARMQGKQFTKLWENSPLRTCFQVGDDGRLHHKRLDVERDKQEHYRRRQSDKGKASAVARSVQPEGNRGSTAVQPRLESGSTAVQPSVVQPEGNSSSASAISSLQTAVSGGSRRPVYQSDRFVVFEWQLDELGRTLGPHLDGFDLHGFFDDLSQRSRSHGLVIPSDRDARWKWLQGQVEAEARRRGLPMASLPAVGKSTTRLATALANIRAREAV
jgi:uncharacterized protein YdaU (DUF1376 family)